MLQVLSSMNRGFEMVSDSKYAMCVIPTKLRCLNPYVFERTTWHLFPSQTTAHFPPPEQT